jgi:hypothetical protein
MTSTIKPPHSGLKASLLWVLCPEEFETEARPPQARNGRPAVHAQAAGAASNRAALPLDERPDGSMR